MRAWIVGLGVALALASGAAAQEIPPGMMQLREDLKLTADQEPAWRDYASAITPSAEARNRHNATGQLLPQLPTPRRVALIEATLAADNADFHRQGLAVIQFYNRLSPNQQLIFDRDTLGSPQGAPASSPGSGRNLQLPPPAPTPPSH